MGNDNIKRALDDTERTHIIEMIEKARRVKNTTSELSKAWMQYIDYLGVNKYVTKYFGSGKKQPIFKDRLFGSYEIGTITRYLNDKRLITKDDWDYYIVNWRPLTADNK